MRARDELRYAGGATRKQEERGPLGINRNFSKLFTSTANLITTRELGEAVAVTLGASIACYLVNHGIVVAAVSIELAVVAALCLERGSHLQLLASASGPNFCWTNDEESLAKHEIYNAKAVQHMWKYYCRRVEPL